MLKNEGELRARFRARSWQMRMYIDEIDQTAEIMFYQILVQCVRRLCRCVLDVVKYLQGNGKNIVCVAAAACLFDYFLGLSFSLRSWQAMSCGGKANPRSVAVWE